MTSPVSIKRFLGIVCVLLILSFLIFLDVTPVSANTIVVNIPYDEDEANEDCSLREALFAAWTGLPHNGCTSGSPGADEIILSDEIYTVDSQLPNITDVVTISGVSTEETIIQASSCDPTQETCTNDHELFWVPWTGTLTLSNLTVRNGKNIDDLNGGVIYSEGTVNIVNSVFSSNRGAYGGVIVNLNGTLFISNSTFSLNLAQNTGGYVYGGVIYNTMLGVVHIETSTFMDNSALIGGAIDNAGNLEIVNSTFSGNIATNKGGGIYNTGLLAITNCTFSNNSATNGGAGIYNDSLGTLNYTNTLIANSTVGPECVTEVDVGTNLNNGGPTQTNALLSGSLGIDNGHLASCPDTDQRGVARPQGEECDIGAYEREPVTLIYLPLILKH
jgi:CSLREA domain-containing protein